MNPVQKALWFVEGHLQNDLSLESIAAACHVSPYHLTRAFAATMGLSLMRYVRARRLSEAAQRLAAGADDILTIALDYQYGSHEAFTRAFRDRFERTPEQVRAQGNLAELSLLETLSMNQTPSTTLDAPTIQEMPELNLIGLVGQFHCESPDGIPRQWEQLARQPMPIPGQIGRTAYGACFHFTPEGNFDYLSGYEVKADSSIPDGLQALRVPANRYAIFSQKGHIASIQGVFAAIWSGWLPESGFDAAEAPTIERYGEEFNPQTGLGGYQIWLPIRLK